MRLGFALIFLYWVAEAAVKVGRPKVAQLEKANVYDRKSINDEIRNYGEKKYRNVKVAKRALEAMVIIKTVLFILVAAYTLFLIGAIISGSFFVLGYQIW